MDTDHSVVIAGGEVEVEEGIKGGQMVIAKNTIKIFF